MSLLPESASQPGDARHNQAVGQIEDADVELAGVDEEEVGDESLLGDTVMAFY